jgi:hypothetical protein
MSEHSLYTYGCVDSLVDVDIEDLCSDEQKEVVTADGDQHFVAGTVQRLISISIDLRHLSFAVFIRPCSRALTF